MQSQASDASDVDTAWSDGDAKAAAHFAARGAAVTIGLEAVVELWDMVEAAALQGATKPEDILEMVTEVMSSHVRAGTGVGVLAPETIDAARKKRGGVAPAPADHEPLTAREIDILRALDSGYSRSEMAQLLFISLNTVKTHQRGLYRKLGVTSRVDAITEGGRRQILTPSDLPERTLEDQPGAEVEADAVTA